MQYPDRSIIAKIKQQAEQALLEDRPLTLKDRDQIGALIVVHNVLNALDPGQDPLKLELVSGIGSATTRALRARGVRNLVDLAKSKPEDLKAFCEVEGVVPRGYEEWPGQALEIIKEWDAIRVPELDDEEESGEEKNDE